jgi:hypothetical protein
MISEHVAEYRLTPVRRIADVSIEVSVWRHETVRTDAIGSASDIDFSTPLVAVHARFDTLLEGPLGLLVVASVAKPVLNWNEFHERPPAHKTKRRQKTRNSRYFLLVARSHDRSNNDWLLSLIQVRKRVQNSAEVGRCTPDYVVRRR